MMNAEPECVGDQRFQGRVGGFPKRKPINSRHAALATSIHRRGLHTVDSILGGFYLSIAQSV